MPIGRPHGEIDSEPADEASRVASSDDNSGSLIALHDIENRTFLAYMDLKFKHFVTYTTLSGFMLAGAFTVADLSEWKSVVGLAGLVVTVLFWVLDERTGSYLQSHLRRYQAHRENLLGKHLETTALPAPRAFTSTRVTRMLFVFVGLGWLTVTLAPIWGFWTR